MPDRNSSNQSPASPDLEQLERKKLVGETAKIRWRELEVFFARGVVIYVATHLDLVNVAWEISRDNTAQLQAWIDDGELLREFDTQASAWSSTDASVWSVVVKPWVLVQAIPDKQVLN